MISNGYASRNKDVRSEVSKLKVDLAQMNLLLSNARDLSLDNNLDPADYKQVKQDCDKKINVLESKLLDLSSAGVVDIESLLNKGLDTLARLDEVYFNADIQKKRQLIGSIFPEKMIFDGFTYRTARLNEAVGLIYKLGAGLGENKKGENSEKTEFSYCVDRIGEFSNYFISDLQSLAALSLDDNGTEQNDDQPNIESKEEEE